MPPAPHERGMHVVQWPADGSTEELLDTNPGRREGRGRRTGTGLILAAVAAVALIVLVAVHRHGQRSPTAIVTPPVPAPSRGAVLPPLVPEGATPALLIGSTLYVVRGEQLLTRPLSTAATTRARLGEPGDAGGTYLLLGDVPGSRVWIVHSLPGRISIFAFDLAGRRELRVIHLEGEVADAAVLDKELYVSTDEGVVGIADRPSDLLDWMPLRGGRAIVADPTRHRLLLLDATGAPAQVNAVSADLTEPGNSAPLPFVVDDPVGDLTRGDLAVAGGRIWAVGVGAGRGVLTRLDPRTLRPSGPSGLGSRLGTAGAMFAAGGERVLLVRSRNDAGTLWCVDAGSGAVVRSWSGPPGPVVIGLVHGAGGAETVYTVPFGTTLQPLSGANCRG